MEIIALILGIEKALRHWNLIMMNFVLILFWEMFLQWR
jgi:hypothetical protein